MKVHVSSERMVYSIKVFKNYDVYVNVVVGRIA